MTIAFSYLRPRHALSLLLALSLLAPGVRAEEAITVFAAASLREALERQAAAYAAEGHRAPRLVFAASSTLARQLAAGAQAQLFLSADERWMETSEKPAPSAARRSWAIASPCSLEGEPSPPATRPNPASGRFRDASAMAAWPWAILNTCPRGATGRPP